MLSANDAYGQLLKMTAYGLNIRENLRHLWMNILFWRGFQKSENAGLYARGGLSTYGGSWIDAIKEPGMLSVPPEVVDFVSWSR